MSYRKIPAVHLATLFCLAVVKEHWEGQVPTLSQAAEELGTCRELAPRLRGRYFGVLVGWMEEHSRPGPRPRDGRLQVAHKRIGLLESLLGTARAVIVAAGIARLAPRRREEIVLAVERMHADHGVSYEEAATQLGLCSRTLRDWRRQIEAGEGLEPKSRAPKNPHGKLPEALSQEITAYVSLFPKDSLAELYRRFIKQNRDLCAEHGHPDLSYGAFSRHSVRSKEDEQKPQKPVRRGRDAPDNFPYRALALMDTTDITCFGFGFQLIPFTAKQHS